MLSAVTAPTIPGGNKFSVANFLPTRIATAIFISILESDVCVFLAPRAALAVCPSMTSPFCYQRAKRYAISWPVRIRRVRDSKWNVAKAVNLSVSGILLQMPRRYRIGECLEWEIDCLVNPGMKTVLRGAGKVVRNGSSRRALAAIHFDTNGASIAVAA